MELFNDGQSSNTCAMTLLNRSGTWSSDECNKTKPFFCYDDKVILITENKTWEEALYYCRENYRDLVSITNPQEQGWVQEKVNNASTPFVWLGLRYTCTLGFWFWVTDEVVEYKNWNSAGINDDCDMSGAMDSGGDHSHCINSHPRATQPDLSCVPLATAQLPLGLAPVTIGGSSGMHLE
ncbi:snaclec 5-like [Archocentrus centrarchus]|uniref:snaclec 5-like n=1 Tax=Archocentrus centrarchus TaxID=63155 RepID=UPI0011EA399A|nr:snaclec 5-like [Archocentrus centrarchus]